MEPASLGSLPDELLLDIVQHLNTARDVAHLGAVTKRTHHLVERNGWLAFVKTHFSSFKVPASHDVKWDNVANRLTYLDRCWDKRGISFNVLQEKKEARGPRSMIPHSQSVSFRTVLDAGLSPNQEDEILAVGAGEDLLVQVRPQSGKDRAFWQKIEGKNQGYQAGTGDVTAVSVIERDGESSVVAGRANGDIQILSAEDDFAQAFQTLNFDDQHEQAQVSNSMRKSPGQVAVSWTEWEPQSNMLASSKGSILALHDLSSTNALSPVAHYDFYQGERDGEPCLVRGIKFMSKDVVACALGGSKEPLRWGKLLPTGPEFFNAVKTPQPLGDAGNFERTTVRAIEPVRRAGSENLLLSAWDDGSYRLLDLRTSSPHAAAYRDRFQPNDAGGSLLVYGAERFVASNHTSRVPALQFYDFRWPKSYYHSTAIPCAGEDPFPNPATTISSNAITGNEITGFASRCDIHSGSLCRFHDRSRSMYWRPDASISISSHNSDHIYSLAKASDLSESFYCGFRGGLVEANWRLSNKKWKVKPSVPTGWQAGLVKDKISLLETGIGLCEPEEWDLLGKGGNGSSRLPTAMLQDTARHVQPDNPRSRLDNSFRMVPSRTFGNGLGRRT